MHIKNQDKVLLASAFVAGLVAGSYLYLTGYIPQFVKHGDRLQQPAQTFTIEGDSYGGMRSGIPPSFQILADGSYRYIPFTELDATSTINNVRQGTLPTDIMRNLEQALVPTDLTLAARAVTKEYCASMVDGIDYRYTVTVSGAEFKLDTCLTNIEPDTPLEQSLRAVWDYLFTLEESATGE